MDRQASQESTATVATTGVSHRWSSPDFHPSPDAHAAAVSAAKLAMEEVLDQKLAPMLEEKTSSLRNTLEERSADLIEARAAAREANEREREARDGERVAREGERLAKGVRVEYEQKLRSMEQERGQLLNECSMHRELNEELRNKLQEEAALSQKLRREAEEATRKREEAIRACREEQKMRRDEELRRQQKENQSRRNSSAVEDNLRLMQEEQDQRETLLASREHEIQARETQLRELEESFRERLREFERVNAKREELWSQWSLEAASLQQERADFEQQRREAERQLDYQRQELERQALEQRKADKPPGRASEKADTENRQLRQALQEQRGMMRDIESQLHKERQVNSMSPGEIMDAIKMQAGESLQCENAQLKVQVASLEHEVRHLRQATENSENLPPLVDCNVAEVLPLKRTSNVC